MKALIVVLIAAATPALAQDPTPLLSAKTMCIKLLNGSKQDEAVARKDLKAWGRYKLVESCPEADVALWISARDHGPNNLCAVRVEVLGAKDNKIMWYGDHKCATKTSPAVDVLVRRLRKDVNGIKEKKTATKN
jgi:hypothetical protein